MTVSEWKNSAAGNEGGVLFDQVISPLKRETFLTDVWGKTFVRIPGHPGKFKDVISWEDLNSMLRWNNLNSRLRLVRDTEEVDSARVINPSDPRFDLKTGGLISALAEGATLILDNINRFVPSVNELTESFYDILRSQTTVNLYAGWRMLKGFDLHWDHQDTIILQVSGRKRWKVYPPTTLHPLDKEKEIPKPTGEPAWEGILEDGDAIYLPRGWWHVAFPLDEPSLHLTVTIVPANSTDFLNWVVQQIQAHPEGRMNVPNLASEEDRKNYLNALHELLNKYFSNENLLDDFLADWEATIPIHPNLDLPHSPIRIREPLTSDTRIRLSSHRRPSFSATIADQTECIVGEVRTECPADLVPALKHLRGDRFCTIGELCACLPDEEHAHRLMIVLTALMMKGVIQRD